MNRWKRIIWIVLGGLLLITGLVLFFVLRASQHVPEFYQQALLFSPVEQRRFRDEFQQQVHELQTDVVKRQRFETTLTEEQINGWLATTVTEEHAHKLPRGMSDPRVSLEDGKARIGCRYQKGRIDTVVWLTAEVRLIGQENLLEIRLRGLKAGNLPFSLEQFQAKITSAFQRAKMTVQWVEGTSDLKARVQLPNRFEGLEAKVVQFEKVQLQEGSLLLSGRTKR